MQEAVEAVRPLAGQWGQLSAAAVPAISLTSHLSDHDLAAFAAVQAGAGGDYVEALDLLAEATAELDAARALRDRMARTLDTGTIDQWIGRNSIFDSALERLYAALRDSRGRVNPEVTAAFADVEQAKRLLPPDTRALIVIVGDIAQGGLNQAAIAIEQVRGAIEAAIAAVH